MRPKEPSGRVRYLNDEEEEQLLAALPSNSQRERVRFLTHTGLRKSEFLGLRWKDIDLKAGILTIPRSKNGESRHVPPKLDGQSNSPSPSEAARHLCPGISEHRRRPGSAGADRIFPKAVMVAGIEDFRFHDLRHTFPSRLAMSGADLLTIKELGGWKNLTIVPRYAHLSPSHRQQAIERLVTRNLGQGETPSIVTAVAP